MFSHHVRRLFPKRSVDFIPSFRPGILRADPLHRAVYDCRADTRQRNSPPLISPALLDQPHYELPEILIHKPMVSGTM